MDFFPPATDKIRRTARKYGIQSCYKSKGTLGDYLINLKDKRPEEIKSGIYEIECESCDKKYIGETKRKAATRWKEHDADYNKGIKAMAENKTYKHASAIAQHCVEESHTIGKKKLIKEVTDFQTFNAWESFYINQNKRDLVNVAEPQTIHSRLFTLGRKLENRTTPQPTGGQVRISTTTRDSESDRIEISNLKMPESL